MAIAWAPTEVEIRQRLKQMVWMESIGFNSLLLDSIMTHDMPEFEHVEWMVDRFGPDETKARLERFLWD